MSLVKKYKKLLNTKKKYRTLIKKVKTELSYGKKTRKSCREPINMIKTEHRTLKKELRELSKLENMYTDVTTTRPKKHKCCALTSKYERCRQQVKYIHLDVNKKGEKDKRKYKAPFCTRHMKVLLASPDKKTLPYGYYFESDLYS